MQRQDLFTPIHKALRALIYEVSLKLLTTDFSDPSASRETITRLQHDLNMLHEHHTDEENHIFNHARSMEPQLIDDLLAAHQEVVNQINAVTGDLERMEGLKDPKESVAAGDEINRKGNELFGYFLSHLAYEERTIGPACWRHYTDEQLIQMRSAIQGNKTPERLSEWIRWMFIAQNNLEVAGMLQGMKMSSPPQVFENMARLAQNTLGEKRWLSVKAKARLE